MRRLRREWNALVFLLLLMGCEAAPLPAEPLAPAARTAPTTLEAQCEVSADCGVALCVLDAHRAHGICFDVILKGSCDLLPNGELTTFTNDYGLVFDECFHAGAFPPKPGDPIVLPPTEPRAPATVGWVAPAN